MTVRRCRPKSVELTALQFNLGQTTKREIIEFCPGANVGALIGTGTLCDEADDGLDSTDLRWVLIPEPRLHDAECLDFAPCHDTCWILRDEIGEFLVVSDWRYQQTYEEIT